MISRKYNAPNVEYNEIDRSQYGSRTAAVGTMSFVTGFADKGDDYDIKYSETLEDFIATYGYPTNEAERYFFNAAYEAFKQGGRLASAKIPYKNRSLDNFAYTAYKVSYKLSSFSSIDDLNSAISSIDDSVTSFIEIASIERNQLSSVIPGKQLSGLIDMDTYDKLLIKFMKPEQNKIIIVDVSRNKYSKDPNIINTSILSTNAYLGYIPVIVSPINALKFQNILQGVSSINLINKTGFQTILNYDTISTSTNSAQPINNIPEVSYLLSNSFEIPLDADSTFSESVSKLAVQQFPTIRFDSNSRLDRKYLKQIGIVVFKMYVDVSNNKKINFTPVEAYVGSLNKKDKDVLTNKSIFIDDIVNQNSQLINVFSNVDFSTYKGIDDDDNIIAGQNDHAKASTYLIRNQTITTLGFFESQCYKRISVPLIESSLARIFERGKDPNQVPLDIVIDGGVSNIANYCHNKNSSFYEPEDDSLEYGDLTNEAYNKWKDIIRSFDNFIKNVRKDCIFLADGPRSLCLIGNEKIIRKTNPSATIENSLIPKIRNMIAIDSSYSAGYCDWFRCLDYTSRDYFWCPPSIKAMGVYLYTDRYANTWDAPAGDNRGRITDAVDIAFNPTVEEAQYFYMQQWNYAMSFPMTGIVLEGQKTFQTEQTALDRVNVRRLCNAIKKGIKEIARHYLYEAITDEVMTNFRDRISDFLTGVRNQHGISEFFIKLDHENNTTETIERNELHVTFAIRPIKTLEFIIINSVIANQSADLEEVVQSILN